MGDDRTEGLVIECERCATGDEEHREDCLVSFIVDREPGAIVFDVAQERALRSLRDGGLLPGVNIDARTG